MIANHRYLGAFDQDIYDNDPNLIVFTPADEFKGPEIIGLYDEKNDTATIQDHLHSTNTCIFAFDKVIKKQSDNIPHHAKFIGSYKDKTNNKLVNLYGILRDHHYVQ